MGIWKRPGKSPRFRTSSLSIACSTNNRGSNVPCTRRIRMASRSCVSVQANLQACRPPKATLGQTCQALPASRDWRQTEQPTGRKQQAHRLTLSAQLQERESACAWTQRRSLLIGLLLSAFGPHLQLAAAADEPQEEEIRAAVQTAFRKAGKTKARPCTEIFSKLKIAHGRT